MPIIETTDALVLTNQETTLSNFSVFKRVSKLALPMAASYTFSIEMSLLVFFLSRLNSDETHGAAITPITNMINALVIIGISPLFAMSMVAGKKIGALKKSITENDTDENIQLQKNNIASVNHHGLVIATVMMPVVALPLVFSEPILTGIFRQSQDVATIAQSFLRPYAIAVPAAMVRLCSEQMIFSFGRTKPAMVMGLLNASIGMSLAAILGFGKMGAPVLKEQGILIGYIVEAYLTAFAFSLYIAMHSEFKDYPFFRPKNLIAHFSHIRDILTIGRHILLGNTVEMSSILGTGAIAGLCGVSAQAAFSTTMQFTLLTFLLKSAFGQSSCQEMSRLIGEKAYQNAAQFGRYSIPTTLAYVTPIPILFSIQPRWLLQLLGQEEDEQYSILRILIPLMALAVLFDAVRYNLLQQLRNNLGDGNRATILSSASMLSGCLLSWALGVHTNLGIYGVALGYLTGIFAAMIGLAVRWKSKIEPFALAAHNEGIASNRSVFFQPPHPDLLTERLLNHGRPESEIYMAEIG